MAIAPTLASGVARPAVQYCVKSRSMSCVSSMFRLRRGFVEAGANLTTKDREEHATPLGWAEYAETLPEAVTRGKVHRHRGLPA
jgi:hypothetical protein